MTCSVCAHAQAWGETGARVGALALAAGGCEQASSERWCGAALGPRLVWLHRQAGGGLAGSRPSQLTPPPSHLPHYLLPFPIPAFWRLKWRKQRREHGAGASPGLRLRAASPREPGACGMRGSVDECGGAGGLVRGARLESRPDDAPANLAQVLPRGCGRGRASLPSAAVCSTFVHVISKEDILLRILGQLPHALLPVVAVTCSQFSRVIVPCEDADLWNPRCLDASMLRAPCREGACSCWRSLCTPKCVRTHFKWGAAGVPRCVAPAAAAAHRF